MKHLTKFLCVIAVVVVILIGLQFFGNGKKVLSKVEAQLPTVQHRPAAPTGAAEDILDEEHPAPVSADANLLPSPKEHFSGSIERRQLGASELLPAHTNDWAGMNPEGQGSLKDKNFLQLIINLANITLRTSPPLRTEAFKLRKCCKLNSSKSFSVIFFCSSLSFIEI